MNRPSTKQLAAAVRLLQQHADLSADVRDALDGLGVNLDPPDADDVRPAEWFGRETLINADRLLKALKRGTIRGTRVAGRWHYCVSDALRTWPHLWIRPDGGKPDKTGQNRTKPLSPSQAAAGRVLSHA